MTKAALVIHGGAGENLAGGLTETEKTERHAALRDVLEAGYAILNRGGDALDAVTEAVRLLEDCPFFNAGKGAVFAADGAIELDSSIMDGRTGACAGISAVRTVKNPVLAARLLMERGPHTLLCARGAEAFAEKNGLTLVENEYFHTPWRLEALKKALKDKEFQPVKGLGTVGAAARDHRGNLAAATSTGGLTGKLPGRVSNSSIAGAGTWAANGTCALSCTGTGDIFIRNATARDVAALIEYKGLDLAAAVAQGLEKVASRGGVGGIIAVGPEGPPVMACNTGGMYRGMAADGAESVTAI